MRRIIYIIFGILFPFLFVVSCSGVSSQDADPADSFVGFYKFTNTIYATNGINGASETLDGGFVITKLSQNQVKMEGAWTSVGDVKGSTVSFCDDTQSNEEGYLVFHFDIGTLKGDVLTFDYLANGSFLGEGGVSVPITMSGHVAATKQELK